MKVYDTGCPICGKDIGDWSLIGEYAHMRVGHSQFERLRLYWRTRTPLMDLLIFRKYGERAER